MNIRRCSATLVAVLLSASGAARGQAPTSAKVEAIPLELVAPDRYQIQAVLEPIRRVSVTAPVDGILRTLDLPVGTSVREQQEIAQLDRGEASARVRIAKAEVKEAEAVLKGSGTGGNAAIAQAQLEAAQARAELAQLDLDRCTLRAPFAGRLLEVPVSPGQFLAKGAKVAELADTTGLRVLVPFDRAAVSVGATVQVSVEGQAVPAKVQATLPLPETLAPLRELATAFTAAWVVLANPKGEFEPGQRVLSPSIPTAPIATIPSRAVREPSRGESGTPSVQVIRNEYVTDIPVRVLGHPGPERSQVSGLFRATDALIVSTSVPLVAGTLIRFRSSTPGAVEGTNPNPAEGGEVAGITPPRPNRPSVLAGSSLGSARGTAPATPRPGPAASKPAAKKAAAPPPF